MGKRWQEVNDDLLKNRQQAFVAQVAEDKSFFKPKALHSKGACQVCDRDDFQAGIQIDNDRRICRQCKDFETIGQKLVDTQYLFWVWGADRTIVKHSQLPNLHRLNLCGTDCTLYFLEKSPEFSEKTPLYDCHLESLNVIEPPNGNPQGYSTGFRFVGKWQKDKTSGDFDFEQFADRGVGIERMGVLRMDVDNLGEIFIRGLKVNQNSMGSLSRVATLSRQLHLFFAGYLATLAKDYPLSQIIYAGGDDVFIIGSWQELPELANKIRTEFKRYCADNDSFTLSGGIALAAGKYPVSKIAEAAGEAESQAKQLKRGSKEKDALTFLDATIGWESFATAVQLKDKICELTDNTNSHALIDRLRSVVIATNEIKKMPKWTNELLYWNQWRWRLIYNLKRMAQRNSGIEQDLKDLQKQLLEEPTNNHQSVIDWLQMPVRWAEFLKRK
jgi:CRISPR-associated protein Csm1